MKKDLSQQRLSVFEQIKQTDEQGNEFWMARQLAKTLDYTDFRNFSGVIEKAKEACKNSGHNPLEHIVEAIDANAGIQHSAIIGGYYTILSIS